MRYNYLKNLVSRNQLVYFDEIYFGMKHHRFKLIIFCPNDNRVTLTYFTARSNFATSAFIWESETMMDTLEMIASCDLEFVLLCKIND